jgi:hypothetical protein
MLASSSPGKHLHKPISLFGTFGVFPNLHIQDSEAIDKSSSNY